MPRERYLQLQDNHLMDNYLLKLCPDFRNWLLENLGDKGMELIIDAYGLYGDPRLTLKELEYNLGLDDAKRYLGWSISRIRRELQTVEALFHDAAAQVV